MSLTGVEEKLLFQKHFFTDFKAKSFMRSVKVWFLQKQFFNRNFSWNWLFSESMKLCVKKFYFQFLIIKRLYMFIVEELKVYLTTTKIKSADVIFFYFLLRRICSIAILKDVLNIIGLL